MTVMERDIPVETMEKDIPAVAMKKAMAVVDAMADEVPLSLHLKDETWERL